MNNWVNEKRGNNIELLKQMYEQQEVPAELSIVVKEAIDKAEKERKEVKRKMRWKKAVGFVAAFAVFLGAFAVGVTTNKAFAATVEDVPILGSLVKVFTAKEVLESDDVSAINLKIPEVEGLKDKELQDKINKDAHEDINKAVEETKKILADYKKAQLETGTAEEDYVPTKLVADYEVKCNSEDFLSFKIWVTQDFASAYYQEFYYNYDLKKSHKVTLEDIFGEDYIAIANKQISNEIIERSKNPENVFFTENDGGFQTIREDQSFYINENGNPVIMFNKYEIAPGYMGMQEFEIKKSIE